MRLKRMDEEWDKEQQKDDFEVWRTRAAQANIHNAHIEGTPAEKAKAARRRGGAAHGQAPGEEAKEEGGRCLGVHLSPGLSVLQQR
jgi:hypothetical protein